jgi:hypothetical protein
MERIADLILVNGITEEEYVGMVKMFDPDSADTAKEEYRKILSSTGASKEFIEHWDATYCEVREENGGFFSHDIFRLVVGAFYYEHGDASLAELAEWTTVDEKVLRGWYGEGESRDKKLRTE